MGRSLTVVKCYGYKLREDGCGGFTYALDVSDDDDDDADDDDEYMDPERLLDRVIGLPERASWQKKDAARKKLGVEFHRYSWGDDSQPYVLAVASSVKASHDGIVPIGSPKVAKSWNAKLDRVVKELGLKVVGPAQWYALAIFD